MFRTFAGGLAATIILATAASAGPVTAEFTNPLDIPATDFHFFIAGKGAGLNLPVVTDAGGKPAFDLKEADASGGDGVQVTLVVTQGNSFGVPGGGKFKISFDVPGAPGTFTLPLNRTFFTYQDHAPVLAQGSWLIGGDVPIPDAPVPAAAVLALTGLLALLAPRKLRRRAAVA